MPKQITRTHYIVRVDYTEKPGLSEKVHKAIRKAEDHLDTLLKGNPDIHDTSITWAFDDDATED